MDAKKIAAERAAAYVTDNMVVGLGTGSTVFHSIHKLGEMVKQGLQIRTVSSSVESEQIARELNIPSVDFSDITAIDLYIDGADEVDENHNLIKGGGGALLREKIIAFNSRRYIVVADESKLVSSLGKFPLPVEVVGFGLSLTLNRIRELGAEVVVRKKGGKDFITDNGNLTADCRFITIADPEQLNQRLHAIPGVVETGIFLKELVSQVVVGYVDGTVQVLE